MSQPATPRTSPGVLRELFILLKPFRLIVSLSIVLGMIGGLSVTVLLATINSALHAESGLTQQVVALFAGLCVLALISSICSDIGSNYVGQHIIATLRRELGEKVLSAPISHIERYRSHRLIPVLTHDVDTISDFAFAFAPLAISLTVTLGCMGYLAMLSWPMFVMMLVAIAIGTVIQYIARGYGLNGFAEAREAEDELQKHYNAIAEGAKELRISARVGNGCLSPAFSARRKKSATFRFARSTPLSSPKASARCCFSWSSAWRWPCSRFGPAATPRSSAVLSWCCCT